MTSKSFSLNPEKEAKTAFVQVLIKKLKQIDQLNKEMKEKYKTIGKLNAILAAQKYNAQKFCAKSVDRVLNFHTMLLINAN